jgi:Spy/CpxP family protein refolding chaperone
MDEQIQKFMDDYGITEEQAQKMQGLMEEGLSEKEAFQQMDEERPT